jgi:hypothetical protein
MYNGRESSHTVMILFDAAGGHKIRWFIFSLLSAIGSGKTIPAQQA